MFVLCLLLANTLTYSSGGARGGGEEQTCDAIGVCASGTCPTGMTLVAPPERSDVYHIRTARGADPQQDPSSYVPGELVTIWITVEKRLIQRRMDKGTLTCFCSYPFRTWGNNDCGRRVFEAPVRVDGRSYDSVNCREPQMESAKYGAAQHSCSCALLRSPHATSFSLSLSLPLALLCRNPSTAGTLA